MAFIATPKKPKLSRLPPFVQSLADFLLPTTVEEQIQSMVHPLGLGAVVAKAGKKLGTKAAKKLAKPARAGAYRAMDWVKEAHKKLAERPESNPALAHWALTGSYPESAGATTLEEAAANLQRTLAEALARIPPGAKHIPAFKRTPRGR